MTAMRKITIEVSEALAERLDAQVAEAGYGSTDAHVVDSLEVYLDQSRYDGGDPTVEQWLRDEVAPTLERRDREKTPDIPDDQVAAILKARRDARQSAA